MPDCGQSCILAGMHDQIHAALALIDHLAATWGATALFFIVALEAIGVPVPGESGLVAASLLAARGDLAIAHVFLAAFLGAVLGDSIGWLIGRRFGVAVLDRIGPRLGLTAARRAGFEDRFRRNGIYVVASARFFVILRQLNGLLAGTSGMAYPRFLAADLVGALAWTSVWGLGPYFFADLFRAYTG